MPSSIPKPARKMGTTTGRGSANTNPVVAVTGVLMEIDVVRTSRVASYASRVTNSSTRSLKVGESVFSSRRIVNL